MNAKAEFLEIIDEDSVKCVQIWRDGSETEINLPVGFDRWQWASFLEAIDFEYDEGYGGQELFGYIWFYNETWAERHEHDGLEWWTMSKPPKIPASLLPN